MTVGQERFLAAFRNVDDVDWKWLLAHLDNSGEGAFWRMVICEARDAKAAAHGENETIK